MSRDSADRTTGRDPRREGLVHVNGVELYYRVAGSGAPLVVLHGGPGLSLDYQAADLERLRELAGAVRSFSLDAG